MNTLASKSRPILPVLSEDTVIHLKNLREDGGQPFFAYVKALRNHRWPLRAIATPLGVSRTAVSNWETSLLNSTPLPAVEPLPEALPKKVKPVYKKIELEPRQRKELKHLAHEASKVRRFTDLDAQSRKDAKRLEDLLRQYSEAGVSLRKLAEACEVSRSSIAQRLRKDS